MLGGVAGEAEDPAAVTEGLGCKGPQFSLLSGASKRGWDLKAALARAAVGALKIVHPFHDP